MTTSATGSTASHATAPSPTAFGNQIVRYLLHGFGSLGATVTAGRVPIEILVHMLRHPHDTTAAVVAAVHPGHHGHHG
jgi:hypothetical protein